MTDSKYYYDIDDNQRRQFIDSEQVRKSWLQAEQRAINYRGSMYWQKSNGHDYLHREYSRGQRKYIGARSPEAENIFNEFKTGKKAAENRLKQLSAALVTQERLNSALRVGRTPNVVIGLLEEIRKAGLQDHLLVIGTNALYAYETHAGVRFHGDVTATSDMDLLWDSRKRITLLADAGNDFNKAGLIGILQKFDPTFELDEVKTRASNDQGYMIDLIKRRPVSLFDDREKQQLLDNHPDDFWASKIRNMDWLLSAPKFKQVIVGSSGKMAEMITVDPRAFALYKVYLAQKEDRDPIKAPRDIAQAQSVYHLVQERMPLLSFDSIRYLPESLRNEKVFDILDPNRAREPSIAEQFKAVPAFDEHSGVIKVVTQTEVIQYIGRGKHVVWDRSVLRGAPLDAGADVTISKDGVVRSTQQKALGRDQ
ncbi:MAG: nucleotidyltransferase domain-containing protein [Burkholderiales bacterium]|nr:nucleotidyltransferase domain-containing protein [Burkholderiales bacterium]